MAPDLITSRRNARVVAARKLDQRKHRQRQGRFLVEGLQLLLMALEAGWRPRELFVQPDAARRHAEEASLRALMDRMAHAGAERVEVSAHVMAALADRDDPQGVLATFDLRHPEVDDIVLGEADGGPALVVVLDRLQDPGNLGTLIRTADAVGARAVALVEPCVDPYDPKSVRGTMGSLFNLPVVRTEAVAMLWDSLAAAGYRIVGADAHEGATWGDGLLEGRVALVLGNEAHGVSSDVEARLDGRARLPTPGGAESLNVAVAGGVLMYGWLRSVGEEVGATGVAARLAGARRPG